MLYLPKHFEQKSFPLIREVVEKFPLATVMTISDGEIVTSHLPLVMENRGEDTYLIGHLAVQNPHQKILDGKVQVIFHGPNTFIHPKWYTVREVPTWNYIAVHMSGVAEIKKDFRSTVRALHKLNAMTEKRTGIPWEFHFPEDLDTEEKLLSAITGYEIKVTEVKAKFKMNQNRIEADRNGVIENLTKSKEPRDHEVAEWMIRLSGQP